MSGKKIDKLLLIKYLNEKKGTNEIAKLFNCSPGLVSQNKKAIEAEIERAAITGGEVIVSQGMVAVDDLRRRKKRLEGLLDELLSFLSNGKADGKAEPSKRLVEKLKGRDAWDVVVKLSAEVRQYDKTEAEFLSAFAPFNALQEIKDEIADFIQKEMPEKYDSFRERFSQI